MSLKPAEPKATSATIAALERVKTGQHLSSSNAHNEMILNNEIARARAEAKEAPEPERLDALEKLRRELDERCPYYCDDKQSGHLNKTWLSGHRDALGVFDVWLKALAKTQPANPAPAGETVIDKGGTFLDAGSIHDELDKAGIPAGALDERVRKLVERSKQFQVAMDRYLEKDRDYWRDMCLAVRRILKLDPQTGT